MSNKKTKTKNKNSLWRYSTIFLIAVIVVWGGFVLISHNSTGSKAVVGHNVNSRVDLGVITENPSLFPSMGPTNAKVTVVEFIDFQCPYCGMASGLTPWVNQYKGKYGDLISSATKVKELAKQGKIRYVVVAMSFLGKESVYATEAGLCANEQGKFFSMDDAIYSAQTQGENTGKFAKDKLEIIAQKVKGLDQSKFKDCLESDKMLDAAKEVGSTAGKFVQGTPIFYVNGKKVQPSWTALQSAISNA